ncbi:MAG: DNA repair protein RecO [Magnetospirillum sp.]|nr:DNA repair protein RecO [Magnetospirillum sp.]
MQWADEAVVLAVQRHGESGAIASLLTRAHGRHPGLVHGGGGKSGRGLLQPGNRVQAWWHARLAEQLGAYRIELVTAHAAAVMDDPARLAALAAACAIGEATLPEREPHPAAFVALAAFLDALASEAWPSVYVHWEMALLRDLGYGLDLSSCAATGRADDLAYVSPRTGRAVSREAGRPWHERLLALPRFLTEGGEGEAAEIRDGLSLTAFFLDRHVLAPQHRDMPAARARLAERFRS